MTIAELGSLGEFVAALATIVTLVYLAIQIRQNTESVRNQSELALSQQLADWFGEVVANPEIAEIYDKAASDPDSVTDRERALYLWFIGQVYLIYEGQYHLYKKGYIGAGAWEAKENAILGLLQNPIVRKWWDSRVSPMNPEFVNYLTVKADGYDGPWKNESIA